MTPLSYFMLHFATVVLFLMSTTIPTWYDWSQKKRMLFQFICWMAVLVLCLSTKATAQSRFVKTTYNYSFERVDSIYSDYGTDFYRISNGKKVYVTLSTMPVEKQAIQELTAKDVPLPIPTLPAPSVNKELPKQTKPVVEVVHNEMTTPEQCEAYIQALQDTTIIVVDVVQISNSKDRDAYMQELKALQKKIGYYSKIVSRANIELDTEISGFAALVYNNCKHRPTVIGYMGLYPIYKGVEALKNAFWLIAKGNKDKKIKALKADYRALKAKTKME